MDLQEHEIEGKIRFELPEGRFPEAVFENEHGRGRMSLYGGHLLELHFESDGPIFWLSPQAIYREGTAIRGGVPLVFPWFGSHPTDGALPSHGFARISDWTLVRTEASDHEVSLTLGLVDTEDTRAMWPHSFQAHMTTTLSDQGFEQKLVLTNTGTADWTWAGGFHPYFAIGNLGSTRVRGLEEVPFINLLDGQRECEPGSITFGEETDRAYTTSPEELRILDTSNNREFVLEIRGSDSTVVWNPGIGKSKADMSSEGPDKFVCVEPARAAHLKTWSERSSLAPGEKTELVYQVNIRHF